MYSLDHCLRKSLSTEGAINELTATRIELISVTALALFLTLVFTQTRKWRTGAQILDTKGNRIQELTNDARLDKFTASSDLSQRGRDLAGEKPYLIRNGSQRELVISRPDHLRDFYKDDTSAHPKPHNLNMGAYFGRILGQAVGVKDGQRWKAMRKHFDPEFSFQASRDALPSLWAGIERWCENLAADRVSPVGADGSFTYNVKDSCRFLPFRLMAAHLYNQTFDEEAYSKLLELNSMHEIILHDVILNTRLASGWSVPDLAALRRARQYNREWKRFNLRLITRARTERLDCPAERIFRGTDEAREITQTEFLHTMDEILFANIDVSAAVLRTMITQLGGHPTCQEYLRDEIDSKKIQSNQDLMDYVAGTSTLLHRVVMESMRFSPAFAFSLPECTAMPKSIGGYHVPSNTAVVIDAARLNTDPLTWGTSALDFCPERFEAISPLKCRYQLMRFGVGGNSGRCLGKHFADAIFKLAAVALLQRYRISSCSVHATVGHNDGAVEFVPIRRSM